MSDQLQALKEQLKLARLDVIRIRAEKRAIDESPSVAKILGELDALQEDKQSRGISHRQRGYAKSSAKNWDRREGILRQRLRRARNAQGLPALEAQERDAQMRMYDIRAQLLELQATEPDPNLASWIAVAGIPRNFQIWWYVMNGQVHLFWGGKGRPDGDGHGHAILGMKDGAYRRVEYKRLPRQHVDKP